MCPHEINLKRVSTKTSRLLLQIFGDNPYHARARNNNGRVSYAPVNTPLSEELLQQHLDGEIVLGSYQLNKKDNTVNWLGWDVDSDTRQTAKEYAKKLIVHLGEIPHAVEFSGSKGYHILIFLEEPMPAVKAKEITEAVREATGLPVTGSSHVECFPKQAALDKQTPYGNLLKVPLGQHPISHNRSRFIDPRNGWEAGPDRSPEECLTNLVAEKDLEKLLTGQDLSPEESIVKLLVPYWVEGTRHELALFLSGYLAKSGWVLQKASDLIEAICKEAGDTDILNRLQAVKDTYRAIADDKAVKGWDGLKEILPPAVFDKVFLQVSKGKSSYAEIQIDGIRMAKGPVFLKNKHVQEIIWNDLLEKGKVLRTTSNTYYWYSNETHRITDLQTDEWLAYLKKNYGINSAESFGKQVVNGIWLNSVHATVDFATPVHNRAYWDKEEEKLFINLGDPKVYELDGKEIKVTYNGDCGHIFKTDHLINNPIIPDFDHPSDAWDHLVNDLSFAQSEHTAAKPQEQAELLKAWIASFFFLELMPTKPLLVAMGDPGSGKTTAMRRLMRVLESPRAEVLELVVDKPDSLRASIASHRLMVLDNLEKAKTKWLVNALNRIATGTNIELRELYKTNETRTITPECFVAMTAVTLPFTEGTLFSRLLPLNMQKLEQPKPEHRIQRELVENYKGIWADLMLKLNMIVKSLKKNRVPKEPLSSRLADFTVFCQLIEDSSAVDGNMLMRGLNSLVDIQMAAFAESSPFITLLDEWKVSIYYRPDEFYPVRELYEIFQQLANDNDEVDWIYPSAKTLEYQLKSLQGYIEKFFGAEYKVMQDAIAGKEVLHIKFS